MEGRGAWERRTTALEAQVSRNNKPATERPVGNCVRPFVTRAAEALRSVWRVGRAAKDGWSECGEGSRAGVYLGLLEHVSWEWCLMLMGHGVRPAGPQACRGTLEHNGYECPNTPHSIGRILCQLLRYTFAVRCRQAKRAVHGRQRCVL